MVIPPLLIVHGANDMQCSVSQAVGFHRGLRAHGLPCEFVRYPGEPHNFVRQKSQMDLLERFARWTYNYIGDGLKKEEKKATN